jgi:hypothetical protein
MSVPLATLRRQGRLAWLHDALSVPRRSPLQRLPLQQVHEAQHWLRFWQGDLVAMQALRQALQRLQPAACLHDANDEQVLAALAVCLARGDIAVLQSAPPRALPVLPAVPAAPAVAEPPAVPLSQVLGAPVPPPPVLPALEEVRVEGAEVLPEIEQTLEQVEISLGEIELAPVSLEPAPSKVPAINDAMQEASDAVTGSLDKL